MKSAARGFCLQKMPMTASNAVRKMQSFFFPCLILNPSFDGEIIRVGEFAAHKRLWQTSTFDLATLAARHKLHLPYQIMDVFLSGANCELEVQAEEIGDALSKAEVFKAMLYLNGTSPFVMPFVSSYSVNQYAGINSRDSKLLAKDLPDTLKSGITSDHATVEAWPNELTFHTIHYKRQKELKEEAFRKAAWQVNLWRTLEGSHPPLRAARLALQTAPMIQHLGSSLLHVWQGIEALFPEVSAELSFRIALLLAQLGSPVHPRADIYKAARTSYGHRSNVAHGNLRPITMDEWSGAWSLFLQTLNAVVYRRKLPDETELISELLQTIPSDAKAKS